MSRQMNIDPLLLRVALGQYATGVAIVTTVDADGRPMGLTVNSFASVSLDPPLVLWSLGRGSACVPSFKACSHFVVNVLAADQVELSNRFAAAALDKFAHLQWQPGLGGAPLLPGCCARFECSSEARHAGGDHLIFVGRVERFDREERPPLVFHGGRYCARIELDNPGDSQ
ncbi:MAG: flavin reductase family protein [Rhodocyclaceae bacterium]|nr:flavin reductase family protein [Rhodocyclaceae bacterium]